MRTGLRPLSLFFFFTLSATISASEPDSPVLSDTSRVQDLDEVVVVTQPKEWYRLRQQPVSSSAFSMEQMQTLGVRDLRELSAYVPSFVMPSYGSRLTSAMYIRGMGSRINNPAIGIYVDGIPLMSKSAFNFHTYELSRVDILRGPQGTLYGQNSEGGLVRMYSKSPLDHQGTDVNVSVGSHFYRNVEAAHYARLGDKAGLSVAGFYSGQNGFFRNAATGQRADDYDEAGGRTRLVWRPSDRLTLDWLADYQYVRQNGFPYGQLDQTTGRAASPATNHQGYYRRNIFDTGLSLRYRAEKFEFNSTTSYQYLKDYMLMDQDYTPQDYMHLEQRQFQNALTEELSLKGRTEGIWHWTVGAFYSSQWLKTWAPVYFDNDFTTFMAGTIERGMVSSMVASMMQRGMTQAQAEAMVSRMGVKVNEVTMPVVPGTFRTPQQNLGLFHESNLELTPRLTLTLGLRYDYSHVSVRYATSAAMTLDATVAGVNARNTLASALASKAHDDFNQLLPKFGLSYTVGNQGSNLYATISKGYRAGGYNIQMFSDILQTEISANSRMAQRGDYTVEHTEADYERVRQTIAYRPETSWNYEVGGHLNFLDGILRLDLAAYYMQVHNQQLSVMASDYGFGRAMVNAGKSRSCGVEASLHGSLLDRRLQWAASYAYTHATFRNYTDSVSTGGEKQAVDYAHKHVPYVPAHTMAISADYRIPFAHSPLHALTLGANVTGQGKTWWDAANSYGQNFYALLGAHADADFGLVSLSLWGRNLTDTRANTFAIASSATGRELYFANRANPLQVGVDIRLHF